MDHECRHVVEQMCVVDADHGPVGPTGQPGENVMNSHERVGAEVGDDVGERAERDASGRLRSCRSVGTPPAGARLVQGLACEAGLADARRVGNDDAGAGAVPGDHAADDPQFVPRPVSGHALSTHEF
ncbi:hypothetical protein G6038_14000 [Rhodococcus sp. 14C212]|uniref:hypothetical protein n=1 Tax=Rhodococcus sp. 14C212 TaxID=2711209 RepID=UPI0013EBBB36|nr:hypothetical protein [Rhodococcus sp. 14C212]NGP06577.1 hypothetical protein [Rhodococcus sp. 14C212]